MYYLLPALRMPRSADTGMRHESCESSESGQAESADSDDVDGPFRRDVNKSERSATGICNDA